MSRRTKLATSYQLSAFTVALVRMKDRAGRLGLYRTMHAIHEAERAIGFEMADIEIARERRATEAARGTGGEP